MFNVVFYHKNPEVDATIIAIIDGNDILMRSRDCITIDLGVSPTWEAIMTSRIFFIITRTYLKYSCDIMCYSKIFIKGGQKKPALDE